MLIGAPMTGYLADRIGLRKVLVITYTLFTLAGGAGLFLTDLKVFLASRFLLGLAGSAAVTSSIIIVNKRLAPEERATWMGYYIAASYVATILLHPLAGVLGNMNWHYAFAIYLAGAPLILIRAHAVMGDVLVRSAGAAYERRKGWRRWLGAGHAEPHGGKEISP